MTHTSVPLLLTVNCLRNVICTCLVILSAVFFCQPKWHFSFAHLFIRGGGGLFGSRWWRFVVVHIWEIRSELPSPTGSLMQSLLDCKCASLTGMYDLYSCTYVAFWSKAVDFPAQLAFLPKLCWIVSLLPYWHVRFVHVYIFRILVQSSGSPSLTGSLS